MILELALSSTLVIFPECDWNNPGADRFTGSIPSAVHNYKDIPEGIRNILERKMISRKYDDIAEITAHSISGKEEYTNLRDMHFGKNKVCISISRDKWPETLKERGLVYCEQEHCIIVPTVCGNVSRVSRLRKTGSIPMAASSVDVNGIDSAPFQINYPELPFISSFKNESDADSPVFLQSKKQYTIITNTFVNNGIQWHYFPSITPSPPIPEPRTLSLMVLGILFLYIFKNKSFFKDK